MTICGCLLLLHHGLVAATISTCPSEWDIRSHWGQTRRYPATIRSKLGSQVIWSMWDANVPLIMYTRVEVHQSNQVMRQFRWRKQILPPPRDMKAMYKLDLQAKTNKNWQDYHKEFIDIWDHRMKFLPICEPFFSSDLAACLEKMP
ncbi:hypothetical protein PVK06_007821 [Gossypium arboreum]|uniref:Uncharacterized protein n=1 Tax=Gossypium arboreum TaxID=29729 RepID=A0ABR0QJR8_GOSAR|nr:hypothetical protein PVK06_007821 [Gossypium arboreum]